MARLMKIKILLILIAIGLGSWNFFLRDVMNLPILSELSSKTIWIIVGIFIVITIIINRATRRPRF